MSRARRYCITWNNYPENGEDDLRNLPDLSYLIVGREVADTGTHHLQAYAEFTKAKTFTTIKRALPKCHIESAKGNSEQNRQYCMKEGNYIEQGEPRQQGKRTDLESFKEAVDEGLSKSELIDSHPAIMCRYPRFYDTIKVARAEQRAKNRQPPEIRVLVGPPGSGKTRQVYDNHDIDDIYVVNHGDGSSGALWFDGYYGQKVVLFDDFYGWVRYDLMLRLLDRYPVQVQTKGGHTWWCPEIIYITSNTEARDWYPNIIDKSALMRRLSK